MEPNTYNIRFNGIEIFDKRISLTQALPLSAENPVFAFDVNSRTNLDVQRKIVLIFLDISIRIDKNTNVLGHLNIASGFEITNFEDLPVNDSGVVGVPIPLEQLLRSIALSTARGVMYSEFRGTYLHNAFLPIIDASTFKNIQTPPTEEVKKLTATSVKKVDI